jgi:hypothetical protein
MYIRKAAPQYSDGSPMSPGDELEVSYPDIRPIPHRGLIHRIHEGPYGVEGLDIIHNSKVGGGVCIVSVAGFSQGQEVRLRRRPASPEHAQAIVERAERLLGHPYTIVTNCEHFTDFCYNGVEGESPTLQATVVIGAVAVLVSIAALKENR